MPDGSVRVGAAGGEPLEAAVAAFTLAGQTDTSFRGGSFREPIGTTSQYQRALVDTQQRIIMAGSANGLSGPGAAEDIVVRRYLPTGELDGRFSGDGSLSLDAGYDWNDSIGDISASPGGKLTVSGSSFQKGAFVIRLNEDGGLDQNFGSGGRALLSGFLITDHVEMPNGSVIAVGYDERNFLGTDILCVASRLTPDGQLDPSFGVQGVVRLRLQGDSNRCVIYPVTRRAGGGVAAAALVGPDNEPRLLALTDSGAVDETFRSGGADPLPLESQVESTDLLTAADGRLVFTTTTGTWEAAVLRLEPTGQVDVTYPIRTWAQLGANVALVQHPQAGVLVAATVGAAVVIERVDS
jgi:uncharacterized delta-60 repeat protein